MFSKLPLDVSFWCLRMKAFQDYVGEKNFLNGTFGPYINITNLPESISRGFGPEKYNDSIAYNISRQTDVVHGDHNYNYDHFQWMMFQIIDKSDKTYVLNSKAVDIRHYMGMNQSYTNFMRTGTFCCMNEDRYYKYIKTCKIHGCYENYNIYYPCKELMDKYYNEYELTDRYQQYLKHYNEFKY